MFVRIGLAKHMTFCQSSIGCPVAVSRLPSVARCLVVAGRPRQPSTSNAIGKIKN